MYPYSDFRVIAPLVIINSRIRILEFSKVESLEIFWVPYLERKSRIPSFYQRAEGIEQGWQKR